MSVITLFVELFLYFFCGTNSHFMLRAQSRDEQVTTQTGGALLQQAEQLTNIRSPNTPSFRLTAQVEVYEAKGKKKEGKYSLLWNSPTTWREDIALSDYSQIRLAHIDKLFISRNPPSPSEQVYRVAKLMDFSVLLRIGVRDQIQRLQERTKKGSRQRWVEITTPTKCSRRVHFDESVPLPILIEYNWTALELQEPPQNELDTKFQLENYEEFHGLHFPRTLRQFESGVLKVQVQVQEWTEAPSKDSDFVPPGDSRWIVWCPDLQRPRLQSPWMLTEQLRSPTPHVLVDGIIDTEGRWRSAEIVRSGGSTADSYWISQMHAQRFTPASCGKTPVEYEMMIGF